MCFGDNPLNSHLTHLYLLLLLAHCNATTIISSRSLDMSISFPIWHFSYVVPFRLECSSPESLHVCLRLILKSPLNWILLEEAFLNQYMLNLTSNKCLDYHLKNSETESKFPIKRVLCLISVAWH